MCKRQFLCQVTPISIRESINTNYDIRSLINQYQPPHQQVEKPPNRHGSGIARILSTTNATKFITLLRGADLIKTCAYISN